MRIIIGITGSSGVRYGVKFLEACKDMNIETDLIVSSVAEKILKLETDTSLEELENKANRFYYNKDLGAPISSGSANVNGMAIVPCSMKTLGSIASGVTNNLITRSADVALKEGEKLVLVPRETPFNQIHLDNMKKLSHAGSIILPASPGFYHKPKNIEELINFIVGKIFEQFDVDHQLYKSWRGLEDEI